MMHDDLAAFSYLVIFLSGIMVGAVGLWVCLLAMRVLRLLLDVLARLTAREAA